ncbi:MAG: hypothetical protein E6G56_03685 [Actinobacteria bacterium]|nr:MAG: hypothetical protein E6G56_03685 [Actinomycetota bacterium]
MATFGFAVAGGSWLVLGFTVLSVFAVSWSWWTRTGSAINQREYHDLYGGQPGALTPSRVGKDIAIDVRNWTRGTR